MEFTSFREACACLREPGHDNWEMVRKGPYSNSKWIVREKKNVEISVESAVASDSVPHT